MHTSSLCRNRQNKNNNNVNIINNTSNDSSGSGISWDISFNYYFMQKPWRPAYVTGGYFVPPCYCDGSMGTYDSSSAFYDAADQRMELNWILPPRECAAFNFSVSPRQLNDNTINLEAGSNYTGISDDSYNFLPYHETLHIDFRNRTPPATSWSQWTTLTPNQLALIGNPKPNLYPQTQGSYFIAGVGSTTGTYGNGGGNPAIPVYIYQNTNIFPLGSDQYQFRIYLKNKSCEQLPSPDYFGTVNPEWNYLYMPDTSENFLSFGQFGPATSPRLINITGIDYRRLNITGANNNPNSSTPIAEASLNTLFTQLSAYSLFVNFGFDLSGEPDSSSKQVFLPAAPYNLISTNQYQTNNLQQNTWASNNIISATSIDFDNNNNTIIFPGYKYYVSQYFMKISTDLSYNVYTDQYPTPTPYPTTIVGPPTRNQVSNDYVSMLGGSGQNLFLQIKI